MLTSADIQSTKQHENRGVVVVVKITTCSRGFLVKALWLSSLKEQESKPLRSSGCHRSKQHQARPVPTRSCYGLVRFGPKCRHEAAALKHKTTLLLGVQEGETGSTPVEEKLQS